MKAIRFVLLVLMMMLFSGFAHAETSTVVQMIAHQPVTPGYMVARIEEEIDEGRLPSIVQYDNEGNEGIPSNFWKPAQAGQGWEVILNTENIQRYSFSTNTPTDELRMTSDTPDWVVTEFPSGDPLWLTKAAPVVQDRKLFLPVIVR